MNANKAATMSMSGNNVNNVNVEDSSSPTSPHDDSIADIAATSQQQIDENFEFLLTQMKLMTDAFRALDHDFSKKKSKDRRCMGNLSTGTETMK